MNERALSGKRLPAKEPLRSNIRDYIQKKIAEEVYLPGDRIVETQLARELNVSQAPVREAILELASIGLLEMRPYSGTYVRKLTQAEIEDIYDTRAFVEEYATRRAAKRATKEQLQEMEEVLGQMHEDQSLDEFVRLDTQFHSLVLDAAESPALKRAWTMLHMSEWTYLSAAVTKLTLADLIAQHWQIFRYLQRRADHTAGAYMFLHIKNFAEELSHHFEKQSDKKHPENTKNHP